jgi:hypothetical protein
MYDSERKTVLTSNVERWFACRRDMATSDEGERFWSDDPKLDLSGSDWFPWWARQDSNRQPDRYERRDKGWVRWFCCIFAWVRSRSLRFDKAVSDAKVLRSRRYSSKTLAGQTMAVRAAISQEAEIICSGWPFQGQEFASRRHGSLASAHSWTSRRPDFFATIPKYLSSIHWVFAMALPSLAEAIEERQLENRARDVGRYTLVFPPRLGQCRLIISASPLSLQK